MASSVRYLLRVPVRGPAPISDWPRKPVAAELLGKDRRAVSDAQEDQQFDDQRDM